LQPEPRLLEAAKNLGAVADFLVITSNGVHSMQPEIEAAAGKKVLSMIDVTIEEIIKRKWKKVGVAGYRNAMVYTKRLQALGLEFELMNDELQHRFDTTVMKVMEGRDSAEDASLAMEIVNDLRTKKVDGIIPGCTELPLLLKNHINDSDLINPARLLAEAAVKYSLQ
jgi:aspartate racemase